MRYFGLFGVLLPLAASAAEPVAVDTIVRAEMDTAFRTTVEQVAGIGKFTHLRILTPLDRQTVIRMNRDTLYSATVLDLSKPVALTMPDTDGRHISLHVINQTTQAELVNLGYGAGRSGALRNRNPIAF